MKSGTKTNMINHLYNYIKPPRRDHHLGGLGWVCASMTARAMPVGPPMPDRSKGRGQTKSSALADPIKYSMLQKPKPV